MRPCLSAFATGAGSGTAHHLQAVRNLTRHEVALRQAPTVRAFLVTETGSYGDCIIALGHSITGLVDCKVATFITALFTLTRSFGLRASCYRFQAFYHSFILDSFVLGLVSVNQAQIAAIATKSRCPRRVFNTLSWCSIAGLVVVDKTGCSINRRLSTNTLC
jgi:hypothetical protein